MLEPWIIEEIRKREDERNRERHQRWLEVPIYEVEDDRSREDTAASKDPEQPERGVVVIDL